MTEDAEVEATWAILSEEEQGALSLVHEVVWGWRALCRSPEDLLALGAILHSLNQAVDGEPPTCSVQVSIAPSAPTSADIPDTAGGVGLEISEQSIELFRTDAVGTGQGTSVDHAWVIMARLEPAVPCSEYDIFEWVNLAKEVSQFADRMDVEIYSLPDFS